MSICKNYEDLQKQYDETVAERDRLDRHANMMREMLLESKRNDALIKIESMSEKEKEYILNHTEHTRSSCSDENPCNGLHSSTYDGKPGYRCRKCMLMEILNGEHDGKYDFTLSIDIQEITM